MVVERIARLLEADIVGQFDGQLVFGHRHHAARIAMHDGDRAAPVTLAADQPVAQPPHGGWLARRKALELVADDALGVFDRKPIQEIRIGKTPRPRIGLGADFERRFALGHHDGFDRQRVFACKIEVALVVRGAAKNRARAVLDQHEIGDPHGQRCARHKRMGRTKARIDALFFELLDHGGRRARALTFGNKGRDRRIGGGKLGA